MQTMYTGALVWTNEGLKRLDFCVDSDKIVSVCAPAAMESPTCATVSLAGQYVFPGFADVHVHFREPGFSYKETIATGCRAAAAGGYTCVCTMPNLSPVPDTPAALSQELSCIAQDACIDVRPYAAITRERLGKELVPMAALTGDAVAFSDDGTGLNDPALLRKAMATAKAHGLLMAAHTEDPALIAPGGCIHDGAYARSHGLPGISSESEYRPLLRDIGLLRESGCAWHVCHISTKESVDSIRQAKAQGLDITCETAPHYLLCNDSMLADEGRFKMNPPIRSEADRLALLEGFLDGTIDMIATDHAPHSAEEKSKGLRGSAMGVVGLETAFSMLYTHLVLPGIAPLSRVIDALTIAPRKRFGLGGGQIVPGAQADFTVFDPTVRTTVQPDTFLSKGRATPFAHWPVQGKITKTYYRGNTVYDSLKR